MKYVAYAVTFGLLAMLCGSLANASYDAPYTGTTLVERMANEPKPEVNNVKASIESKWFDRYGDTFTRCLVTDTLTAKQCDAMAIKDANTNVAMLK